MYAYAGNNPVNSRDPSGLSSDGILEEVIAIGKSPQVPQYIWEFRRDSAEAAVRAFTTFTGRDGLSGGLSSSDGEEGECSQIAQGSFLANFTNDTALTLYGIADAVTLGYFSDFSELLPGVNVNRQALSYQTGLYGTSGASIIRLFYSGSVAAIKFIPNITAQQAVGIRNSIKGFFSGLGGGHPRSYRFSQIAGRYGNNERAIINASSRTNPTLNAAGGTVAVSSSEARSKANDGNADNAQCY